MSYSLLFEIENALINIQQQTLTETKTDKWERIKWMVKFGTLEFIYSIVVRFFFLSSTCILNRIGKHLCVIDDNTNTHRSFENLDKIHTNEWTTINWCCTPELNKYCQPIILSIIRQVQGAYHVFHCAWVGWSISFIQQSNMTNWHVS